MKVIPPIRAEHSYVQHLAGDPDTVFRLLCPVREADWIGGWDPPLVVSASGLAERDCVFTTRDGQRESVWYISEHDPQRRHVEMLKITPGVTACRLCIDVEPAPTGSSARVTYMHTSLDAAGDAFVASFTAAFYQDFMQAWELRLNHYLQHGKRLTG